MDAQVDAASFFARTAVVLPAHVPFTSERARSGPGWRRSRWPPYQEVLTIAGASPLMRLKLGLSWSEARVELIAPPPSYRQPCPAPASRYVLVDYRRF